jgi:hypothetical protein
MSKILVSGCSYTDDYWTRLHGFPVWPDLFDADVTNLGKRGLGNDYILHSIIDRLAVEEFDYVIAMWTEFLRIDLEFDDDEYNYEQLPWVAVNGNGHHPPDLPTDFSGTLIYRKPFNYELFVKRALRTFYIFQQVMENIGIPYLQVVGCRCMPPALNYDVSRIISDSPIVDKINPDHFLGWPIFPDIGGWCIDDKLDEIDPSRTELRIGGGDNHPNKKGHEHIFDIITKENKNEIWKSVG